MANDQTLNLLSRLAVGPKTAKELAALLNVSQPTVSRIIAGLGNQVVALGRGRSTRYALPRVVRGLVDHFPVYRIDPTGNAHLTGTLQALVGGSYWWQAEESSDESRLFDYLPWFVQDMRPDGFVGRAFAQKYSAELGLPTRLTDWTDDDVLIALARRGEDHIGDLIVGDESINRYLRAAGRPPATIQENELVQAYPTLAKAAMAGDQAGSSAGGEQPKFTAVLAEGNVCRHVLVKFSGPLSQPDAGRWADLLRCEYLALELIRQQGIDAADSRILEAENRVFLEVTRFDRIGLLGRSPVVSLRALDAEFVGSGAGWTASALGLVSAGIITKEDARRIRWLHAFGGLIANTDMHQGNISFLRTDRKNYGLAPVYDMLPMFYRPTIEGLPQREFEPPLSTKDEADVWPDALQVAIRYWELTVGESALSMEFRGICRRNLEALLTLEEAPRIIR